MICCCSWPYTVDTAGQPTPAPCRFWSVERRVAMRACWSCFELPVGKGAAIPGLLIMWPAFTFAFRLCGTRWDRQHGEERRGRKVHAQR